MPMQLDYERRGTRRAHPPRRFLAILLLIVFLPIYVCLIPISFMYGAHVRTLSEYMASEFRRLWSGDEGS